MNRKSITRAMAAAGGILAILALPASAESGSDTSGSSIVGAMSQAAGTLAAGSCPIAGAYSGGQPLVIAGGPSAGAGSTPEMETTASGTSPAPAASMLSAGGCSVAVPPPGDGVSLVAASPVVNGASTVGDTVSSNEPVEQAQVESLPSPSPGNIEQEPEAMAAAAKPVVNTVPRKRAKPEPVPDSAKQDWWPARASGKLNLRYAGQASFTEAIALLFDGVFENPESANQHIRVKDSKGRATQGSWVVATNRQMLLFNVAPGLYSIDVGSGLKDKGGRNISQPAAGLVAVR